MSKYEWEKGTITLPTKIAAGFRKELGVYINKRITRVHGLAVKVYEGITTQYKGKRKVDFRAELERKLESHPLITEADFEDFFYGRIDTVFFGGDKDRKRPMKPTLKSMGPKCFPSKGIVVHATWFRFSVKGNEVVWNVPENNHACRDAHEHPVAQVLFRMLGRVTWTRRTGGEIRGSDEYRYEEGLGAETKYEFKLRKPSQASSHRPNVGFNPPRGYYNTLLGTARY